MEAGCFSHPILKLPRLRCAWAPQYLSLATSIAPKVSVSLRVKAVIGAGLLKMAKFYGCGFAWLAIIWQGVAALEELVLWAMSREFRGLGTLEFCHAFHQPKHHSIYWELL